MIDMIPLSFGKYKGQTPEEIAEHDPGYIVWLYENAPGNVSHDLYVACEQDDMEDAGPDEGDGWEP